MRRARPVHRTAATHAPGVRHGACMDAGMSDCRVTIPSPCATSTPVTGP